VHKEVWGVQRETEGVFNVFSGLFFNSFSLLFLSLVSLSMFSLSLTLSLFRRRRPAAGGGAAVFSGETTPKPKLYTPNPFVFSH
jgi:hypothetical protein